MSDALPLPPRPNVEQYRKLAKDLQNACRSGGPAAVREWATRWVEKIARLNGREDTPELRRWVDEEAQKIEGRWRSGRSGKEESTGCKLSEAQYFLGRAHGFASWPKLAEHIEALNRTHSPVSNFEVAADAIVAGDLDGLTRLLRDVPAIVHARSTREHRSTLLHYVSANGVEDFRQKTPKNIVEITRLLLEAGAEVNAESEAYGGGSTTLELTATSVHPERAGVQENLMSLLLEHGAAIDSAAKAGKGQFLVNACLANGRGKAAEFLAQHGARLDLEGAAGTGRLELVRGYFDERGSLKPSATQQQMKDGFAWACEFGHTGVVEFLLQKGVAVDEKLRHGGVTGLHWAAFGGHPETVKLLLRHGANVDVKDAAYGATPLEWALYEWGNSHHGAEPWYETASLLARAGAKPTPQWLEGGAGRRATGKIKGDARMVAALRGESQSH